MNDQQTLAAPTPADLARPESATPTYLGPALVRARRGHEWIVELPLVDRPLVPVRPAFTFPFEPAVDDSLLVLGQGDGFYAVGVLSTARPTSLTFPGDVDVHAATGSLTLSSDRAVELVAPRVSVRAGVMRTLARSVVEKTDELRRWVRGLCAIRAGRSRRVVDGEDSTRCQSSTTIAKDTVTIDGDQLHLGH